MADELETQEPRSFLIAADSIEVRSADKREVAVRLLPWDTQIDTAMGPEMFARGAFDGTDPSSIYIYGPEHEMRWGRDQKNQPKMIQVPAGRGIEVGEDDLGPTAVFRMARTAAGDEALSLMADKIISGISVEFSQVPGGTSIENRSGRRVRVHNRARLLGATPTHRPAYGDLAAVLEVRSQEEEAPMGETDSAPVVGAETEATNARIFAAITEIENRAAAQAVIQQKFLDRLEASEEQNRSAFDLPGTGSPDEPKANVSKGEWLQMFARLALGELIPDSQMRTIADVITADNPGVVPPTYLTEMIGIIDASRPFLSTTRRLPEPPTMSLVVPVITQRPLVGKQTTQKSEVASRKTIIGTETFNAVTIAGAGDLSLQIIKKSSPAFLDLWVELLGEAYAIESEDIAVLALLDAAGGVGAGNPLNPANLSLGSAFVNSFDAIRRPPDTIWLSTQAIGEFIDAKATTTNQPLYPGLNASATAAGGITGTISGLRAVHVPALDAHGAYAIVGPSNGFAWAEAGTYTLQADVPTKAGRDVALVGLLYPAPWYPAAFSLYNVAS